MTGETFQRYSRLMAIEGIGKDGVELLNRSTVLIVGCGALGSMAAMQLAASGVGHIRIVDFDTVDISNLQRQFFFRTSDVGKNKAAILAQRILELNPTIKVRPMKEMLNRKNAAEFVIGCDFVVEATDNPASMVMIDSVCNQMGMACVLAGVSGFSGQVLTCLPGKRRYDDIFSVDNNNAVLPCSLSGVAGPAAALASSIETSEAIKYPVGTGTLLSESIFVYNLLTMRFDTIPT